MKGSVIITAGGIGKRMGADLPKQFLEIQGKPILLHCLEKFHSFDPTLEIIITLPTDWISYWNDLINSFHCKIPHRVSAGGLERFHSIQLALNLCTGDFIMVHDGVRPLVSHETIQRCIGGLNHSESVIPVLAVKDSLRFITQDGSKMVDRNAYKLVHTPQCFKAELLKQAYQTSFQEGMTDDASVVESLGIEPFLVESNEENIKITTNSDLLIAAAYMKQKNS
jgi:2-C-methyl-D-erythritol 4-phosphate cytidylyltransferase